MFSLVKELIIRIIQLFKASLAPKLIFTRTACLGNDAIKLMGFQKYYYLNIQKGRVDYLNNLFDGNKFEINIWDINLILRNDMKNLFLQQFFGYKSFFSSPNYFILDTYSELTDQSFQPFDCKYSPIYFNYSDLSNDYKLNYNCEGLLQPNKIYTEYDLFIRKLKFKFKNIKIIFILFPVKFDKRQKYLMQNDGIINALTTLELKYDNVHIIEIPDYLVENADDNYPYHFSDITKTYVSIKMKMLIDNKN